MVSPSETERSADNVSDAPPLLKVQVIPRPEIISQSKYASQSAALSGQGLRSLDAHPGDVLYFPSALIT